MPLSQRLIHTRVYGQGIAVLTTLVVMGFGASMKAEGGEYRILDGRLMRGEHVQTRLRNWYSASPEEQAARRAQEDAQPDAGPNYDLLVPLVYAPLLPLMIIGLRGRVSQQRLTQIVGGTICVALAHAGSVMFTDSTIQMN